MNQKVSLTRFIGVLMMLHSLSGAALNMLKSPYGANLDTCFVEVMAGFGLIRSRKATTELEKKVDDGSNCNP